MDTFLPLVDPRFVPRLPDAAAAKLQALERLADDQAALARVTHDKVSAKREKLMQLRGAGVAAGPQHDALREELVALQEAHDKRTALANNTKTTAQRCRGWLYAKASDLSRLIPVVVIDEPPPAGELLRAIEQLRREIGAWRIELNKTRVAPFPPSELKERAREHVRMLGARAAARLEGLNGAAPFAVKFGPVMSVVPVVVEPLNIIAWAAPEMMIEALEREIDAAVSSADTVSAAEKTRRMAELEEWIIAAERVEETLIVDAQARNLHVLRRPDASPLVVVGMGIADVAELQAAATA